MFYLKSIYSLLLVCLLSSTSSEAFNVFYKKSGTFWQITDVHWDLRYSEEGDPTAMCHFKSQNLTNNATHNGYYGNYLCDSPWPLVHATLDAMQQLDSKPDFILWTGDISPHVSDPEPQFETIFFTLSNVTAEIKKRFESVPLLPVLGNHDTYPKDSYPDCPKEFFERYLTEGGWNTVLDAQQQKTFKNGGYYQHDLPDGNVLAVLNTNLYYVGNKLGSNDPDPCGQFQWLVPLLREARNNNSKVIISAHSPPGFFERMPIIPFFNITYNEAYTDLIAEYGDVIHSHIYGHLHTDSFRIFYGNDASMDSVAFLAPSVTPWQMNKAFGGTAVNPSVRLYTYDALSVLDYAQYHLNLTRANAANQTSEETQAVVNATNAFSVANVNNLTTAASAADTTTAVVDTATGSPLVSSEQHSSSNHSVLSLLTGQKLSSSTTTARPDDSSGESAESAMREDDVQGTATVMQASMRELKSTSSEHDLNRCQDGDMASSAACHQFQRRNLQFTLKSDEDDLPKTTEGLRSVKWDVYYNAAEVYGLKRLDVSNMKELLHNLRTDDTLFAEFYKRNSAGIDNGVCDRVCKRNMVCAMANVYIKDLFKCTGYTKSSFAELLGKTFKKRDPEDFAQYFTDGSTTTSAPAESSTTPNQETSISLDVNTTNPYAPSSQLSPAVADDINRASGYTAITVGVIIALLWVMMAVLFIAIRWRRQKRDRLLQSSDSQFNALPSLAARGTFRQGYVPLSSTDH